MTEIKNNAAVYDIHGNYIRNLVQWDVDVSIKISCNGITSAQPVHFFRKNSLEAYTVETEYSSGGVIAKIPNILLRECETIFGYIYATEGTTSRSVYGFRIPVERRPQPADYVYENTIDYLNIITVLEQCKKYAEAAEKAAGAAGLPIATASTLGGVIIGNNISVEEDGTISIDDDFILNSFDNSAATDSDTEEMLDDVFGQPEAEESET